MLKIETNKAGFIVFKNRYFGFAGDRSTWAKVDNNKLIISRALKGTISDAYERELIELCKALGVIWQRIPSGGRVEVPFIMEG